MNSRFHLHVSAVADPRAAEYHRRLSRTIAARPSHFTARLAAISALLFAIVTTIGVCASAAPPAPSGQVSTSNPPVKKNAGPGFAPDDESPFTILLQLAPPGPNRASRAIAIFDRQLDFQRKISFHPDYGASLQAVIDQMPPRQSTLIRAAALYSKNEIPWSDTADATHMISVTGRPRAADYLYTLAPKYASPEVPQHFSGMFALRPAARSGDNSVGSVVGTLAGELMVDTYGLGQLADTAAAAMTQIHGDLKPPWDTEPGNFNHHDQAALARLRRQMPHLAAALERYLRFNNVVDEFQSPAGPVVVLNLDVEARLDALKKYPKLSEFYRKLIPTVTATSAVYDSSNNYLMRTEFKGGHIRVTLMNRGGLLTPFNGQMRPAGDGIALNEIEHYSYRTVAAGYVRSLAMNFGLSNISFVSDYKRDADGATLTNHMNTVPELVAPAGIHKVMDLIAGEFLRVLATGSGGMNSVLSSRRTASGAFKFAGAVTAEFDYSPTLELLARIGDAIAKEHDTQVRKEERALGEELFESFVADYNDARPALLALDGVQENTK